MFDGGCASASVTSSRFGRRQPAPPLSHGFLSPQHPAPHRNTNRKIKHESKLKHEQHSHVHGHQRARARKLDTLDHLDRSAWGSGRTRCHTTCKTLPSQVRREGRWARDCSPRDCRQQCPAPHQLQRRRGWRRSDTKDANNLRALPQAVTASGPSGSGRCTDCCAPMRCGRRFWRRRFTSSGRTTASGMARSSRR
jgi:hypothetical protein